MPVPLSVVVGGIADKFTELPVEGMDIGKAVLGGDVLQRSVAGKQLLLYLLHAEIETKIHR